MGDRQSADLRGSAGGDVEDTTGIIAGNGKPRTRPLDIHAGGVVDLQFAEQVDRAGQTGRERDGIRAGGKIGLADGLAKRTDFRIIEVGNHKPGKEQPILEFTHQH